MWWVRQTQGGPIPPACSCGLKSTLRSGVELVPRGQKFAAPRGRRSVFRCCGGGVARRNSSAVPCGSPGSPPHATSHRRGRRRKAPYSRFSPAARVPGERPSVSWLVERCQRREAVRDRTTPEAFRVFLGSCTPNLVNPSQSSETCRRGESITSTRVLEPLGSQRGDPDHRIADPMWQAASWPTRMTNGV
jgi:hypothetical protein